MSVIDLHSHSRYSDGAVSISELLYTYSKAGVEMMALTDHDCILGLEEARLKAVRYNMLFVNGVEISTSDHDNLHFLGYNFDTQNSALKKLLETNTKLRLERGKKTVKLLQEIKIKSTE
jgi:predicted metal-dependent phosphoesterase TrpH